VNGDSYVPSDAGRVNPGNYQYGNTRPRPRLDRALKHVELLTGDEDTLCHFRMFRDEKTKRRKNEARNLRGRLRDLWAEIEAQQRDGWGVYIIVNEGGHNTASITRVRALFIDCDGTIPAEWHAQPDFIVRRDATHCHAYWLVGRDTGMRLDEFRGAQKRLIAHYGSDPNVHDLPRVMRLAGTLHLKNPNWPLLLTLDGITGNYPDWARSPDEIMAGIPELPAEERAPHRSTATGRRLWWKLLRERLSWIHPAFNGTRPACYPPPSPMRAPLKYDSDAWLTIALILRDGAVPLLDDELQDWITLIEEWSAGTLWLERTKERLTDLNFPEEGIEARLGSKERIGGTKATVATIIAYALDAGCPLPPDDEPEKTAEETFGDASQYAISGAGRGSGAKGVNIVRGAGGAPQAVEWLWPGWLPRGKLTVLSGEKGAGKSTLTYHVLATITRGGTWPDGTLAPIGDVLIWSAEDDWFDTILPRLMAAGADLEHVYHVANVTNEDGSERWFDPAQDMAGLLTEAQRIPNLMATLIDPIVSAVAGDSHKNAETRRGLQPLVDFAGARRAALIGITHFSKNTQGRSPIERLNGSLAFGAIARMVWGAVKSEDEDAPRRLVRIASNIGPMGDAYDYTLEQRPLEGHDFSAQRVAWGQYHRGSARKLIDDVQGGDRQSELGKAKMFLRDTLEKAGSFGEPVSDLKRAAEAHSLSWGTIKRAKEEMPCVHAQRRGEATPPCWHWVWRAPEGVE
jgi:putative DNA primase/helicase